MSKTNTSSNNFGLTFKEIEIINKTISLYSEVEEVLIFGSRVKGEHGRTSDIDLRITNEVSYNTFLGLHGDLNDLPIPYKIDLVRLHALQNTELKESIQKEAKKIWSK